MGKHMNGTATLDQRRGAHPTSNGHHSGGHQNGVRPANGHSTNGKASHLNGHSSRGAMSGPEYRDVTDHERRILGQAATRFQEIVALASPMGHRSWELKAKGPLNEAGERHRAELQGLLEVLLQPFDTATIMKRLAWIMDDEGRYNKLVSRLERMKVLLGNDGKHSDHPFEIKLSGPNTPASSAFTNGFRAGCHLKALRTAREAWLAAFQPATAATA